MTGDLPDLLSGEQVRCVLHISKRKCAWMLDNGFIPCQNTGKPTRKYTVRKEDLLRYIEGAEQHPERYATPCGEFTAAKYTIENCRQYLRKAGFPSSLPVEFRTWLKTAWETLPDALNIRQVIAVTGYTASAVNRWLSRGLLNAVQTQTGKLIPKEWLIDFYCGYGYTIVKMSERHIKLMREYFDQSRRSS